jgi:2,3-bisphosphoglycerate-independent phosphoglycerate mutase
VVFFARVPGMPAPTTPRPVVLVILDGFGERADPTDNAVRLAKTPNLDALYASYPHSLIGTSGPDVGLPVGQMGNSEVGHLNFGAGRIALMDISRIDVAVAEGALGQNPALRGAIDTAKKQGGRLHLLGLVSDGGVHSSLEHLFALIDTAAADGVEVVVHAFLDGRDTPPESGGGYVRLLLERLQGKGKVGVLCGRYWAMDRDKRWDRVERAYRAIVMGDAPRISGALEAVQQSYAAGKADEFVEPVVIDDYAGVSRGRDAAIFFNFRPDRAREITEALTAPSFKDFERPDDRATPFASYVCMTTYDRSFPLPVAFAKETYPDIFPEIIARHGKTQFRCAETEKYAHVTYFFNGGREEPFAGEERQLIPSPRDVKTYDEKPEMSAPKVADATASAIRSGKFDFVLVNFANPDMVGHSGKLEPAIHAVEAVDSGIGAIVDAARAVGGAVLITADHGNCEMMRDPATGGPHTAHTLNPVPLLYVDDQHKDAKIRSGGRICDVAPTILKLMGLPKPTVMSGVPLF